MDFYIRRVKYAQVFSVHLLFILLFMYGKLKLRVQLYCFKKTKEEKLFVIEHTVIGYFLHNTKENDIRSCLFEHLFFHGKDFSCGFSNAGQKSQNLPRKALESWVPQFILHKRVCDCFVIAFLPSFAFLDRRKRVSIWSECLCICFPYANLAVERFCCVHGDRHLPIRCV